MKRNLFHLIQALVIGLSLSTLTGCAPVIGAVGTGFSVAAEYMMISSVSKTITFEFDRVKKALLVALCRMDIQVDRAREIKDGEEILANANKIKITIELKRITLTVTRMKVKASRGFMIRDRATAQEIVNQTDKTAEKLTSYKIPTMSGFYIIPTASGLCRGQIFGLCSSESLVISQKLCKTSNIYSHSPKYIDIALRKQPHPQDSSLSPSPKEGKYG